MDESVERWIEQYEQRPIYRRLDPEVLASIPDERVEIAIIDFIASRLEGRYQHEAEILAQLPAGLRALYLTWGVMSEVNNGGFNQYYWNGGVRFAEQAVAAFEFFSAHAYADLMREANELRAQESMQIEELEEEGTIAAFADSYKVSRLRPLDDRFHELGDRLSALHIAKIRSEPLLFCAE